MRSFILSALIVIMLAPTTAPAQEDAALARVQPFLEAVQAADGQRRLFAVGNMTREMVMGLGIGNVAQRMGDIGERIRGFEYVSAELSGSQIYVRMRASDGRTARVELSLGPAPYYQIAAFEAYVDVGTAAPMPQPEPAPMPQPEPEPMPAPMPPPEPMPQPEPEPEPAPMPQPEPEPAPRPQPQPQPQAEPEQQAQFELRPQPQPLPPGERHPLIERRLVPLLEILNANDEERRAFAALFMTDEVKERTSIELLSGQIEALSRQLGAFRVTAAEFVDNRLIAYLDLLDSGTRAQLILPLGPGPAYRIDGMVLALVAYSDSELPTITPGAVTEQLSEFVNSYVAERGFSGAVVVARGGEMLYSGAFGPADPDAIEANTLRIPFNIGPVTAMFTTVAILSLAEDELLDLDATVGTYLPDWPEGSFREARVGDLMAQVSGLGPIPSARYQEVMATLDSVDDWLVLVREAPMVAEPGTRFVFSDANFIVLAAIAEQVTGRSYAQLLQERVYAPAGMNFSAHYRRTEIEGCCVIGILEDGGPHTPRLPLRGSPAAGSYASVIDIWRFAEALVVGELVTLNTLVTAMTPVVIPATGFAQGVGFSMFEENDVVFMGATGRGPGMGADLTIDADSGTIIVVLSNVDAGARPLANVLRQILRPLYGVD